MKNLLLALGAFAALSVGAYAVASGSFGTTKQVLAVTAEDAATTPQYGVSIGTVNAQLYSESGLSLNYFNNAKYVAKVSETTYLGFDLTGDYDGNEVAQLRAISTSGDKYVTIPDYIDIDGTTYPVWQIYSDYSFRYGIQYGTANTLTIPATVGYISNDYNISSYGITDFYFLGNAPDIDGSYFSSSATVHICNKEDYADYVNNYCFANTVIVPYGWEFDWITVNVEKPGEFAETYLTQNDYDWANGIYVKVTGNINATDLNVMKNLSALQKLDLSETSITSIPDYFMQDRTSLREMSLPQTVTALSVGAFYGCTALQNFDLARITAIPNSCFYNCRTLSFVDLSGVEVVGDQAFHGCSSLSNLDFSNIKTIGAYAFQSCTALTTVNATAATSIGKQSSGSYYAGYSFDECINLVTADISSASNVAQYTFGNCSNLRDATLCEQLTTIPGSFFYNCTSLTDITLPVSLSSIEDEAFYGCTALTEITLPASLHSIGRNSLANTGLTTVKCKAAAPPTANGSFVGNMDMTRTYLYVPPFSKDFYRNTQYWSDFYLMRDLDEPVDYIYVDRDLTINLDEDYDVLGYNPDMTLAVNVTREEDGGWYYYNGQGQLTATGEGTLSVGQLSVSAYLDASSRYGNSYDDIHCPTLINYADKMRADNVTHTFTFTSKDEWYFISLPYDVKVSDIEPGEGTYWVIRRYDGEARAAGETAWKDLTADDTMEAYKGYIISATCANEQYTTEYGDTRERWIYPSLTFTSGNSLTKNNMFTPNGVIIPLEEHIAEFAHNRSWNLVGNPFPAYFDMHNLNEEFTSPITVWADGRYTAFSPVDDDYVLRPYEAFFVQRPLNLESVTFNEAGRMHTYTIPEVSAAPAATPAAIDPEGRNVFNFNMTGNDRSDRARIVLNPEASMDYELDRDAAKFFSNSAAEIYVSAKDAACAIDERPVADGTATLGLRATAEGVYTLSLSGKYSDEWTVTLTDNLTGNTAELTREDYTFTATTGDNASRFAIAFARKAAETGVDSIIADFGADTEVTVSAINGVNVYNGPLSGIKVATPGVYIVTAGNVSRKVTLK